jgi:hypothetical protein
MLHRNNLCLYCGHAHIWHSKKQKPPTDEYLAFNSTRPAARTPKYEKKNIGIGILVPTQPELRESNVVYCDAIEILPV